MGDRRLRVVPTPERAKVDHLGCFLAMVALAASAAVVVWLIWRVVT